MLKLSFEVPSEEVRENLGLFVSSIFVFVPGI